MSLSEIVKERRILLRLSLQELADRAGMTKGHIHSIECGKSVNPTIETICALAPALQMSATALFREAIKP